MCLLVPSKPKRKGSSRSKKSSASSTSDTHVPAARPVERSTTQPHAVTVPVPVSFSGRLPECYWDDRGVDYAYVNDTPLQQSSRVLPSMPKPRAVDILTEKIEQHQDLTKKTSEDVLKGLSGLSERLATMEDGLKTTIKATDDNVKSTLDATKKGTDAAIQAVNAARQEEKDRRAAKQSQRQQRQQQAKVDEAQKEIARLQEILKQGQARDALLGLNNIKKEVETLREPVSNTPEQPLTGLLHRLEALVAEMQKQASGSNRVKEDDSYRRQSGHQPHRDWRHLDSRPRCDFGPSVHYHYHGLDDEESDWYQRAPLFFGRNPPRRPYRYDER